jgi:hypothetical protein
MIFDWLWKREEEVVAEPIVEDKRLWVCNIPASYVDRKNETVAHWLYILYVTESGKKLVQTNLQDAERERMFGVFEHPTYWDVINPWLVNNFRIENKYCSFYATASPHIYNPELPKNNMDPDTRKNATILRLVPKEPRPDDNILKPGVPEDIDPPMPETPR